MGGQVVKRALILCVGVALLALPLAASAQGAKPSPYKVGHNLYGQPDLEGNWTNATITPQTRPATYGNRLVHTPAEVKQLEGRAAQTVEAGNRATDPNAPPPEQGVDPGGYNRGWLDPGSQVMRVHGEPRTSILTTPDGQAPLNKQGQRVGQGPGRNVALGEAQPRAQQLAAAARGQFEGEAQLRRPQEAPRIRAAEPEHAQDVAAAGQRHGEGRA